MTTEEKMQAAALVLAGAAVAYAVWEASPTLREWTAGRYHKLKNCQPCARRREYLKSRGAMMASALRTLIERDE